MKGRDEERERQCQVVERKGRSPRKKAIVKSFLRCIPEGFSGGRHGKKRNLCKQSAPRPSRGGEEGYQLPGGGKKEQVARKTPVGRQRLKGEKDNTARGGGRIRNVKKKTRGSETKNH